VINRALIGVDDGAIFNVFKNKMANIVLRHLRRDFDADIGWATDPNMRYLHSPRSNLIGLHLSR